MGSRVTTRHLVKGLHGSPTELDGFRGAAGVVPRSGAGVPAVVGRRAMDGPLSTDRATATCDGVGSARLSGASRLGPDENRWIAQLSSRPPTQLAMAGGLPPCWGGPAPATTGGSNRCARVRQSPRPVSPNALTETERRHILSVLRSEEFCDLAPAQIWARLLDDGQYLCSISTMYGLLRAAGECGERRRQRTHPAKKKPELMATAPNRVWSWDIAKLRGPVADPIDRLFGWLAVRAS